MTDSSEEEKDMDLQCVLNVESAGGLVEMKKSSVTARGSGLGDYVECGATGRTGKGTCWRGNQGLYLGSVKSEELSNGWVNIKVWCKRARNLNVKVIGNIDNTLFLR